MPVSSGDEVQEARKKRWFEDAVTLIGLGCFGAAVITAIVSAQTVPWWSSFLQNVSVTFLGLGATIVIINKLIEREAKRLTVALRSSNRTAARKSLQRLCHVLGNGIPSEPEMVDLSQLQWIEKHVDRTRVLCDSIAPGPIDPDLQLLVNAFDVSELNWTEAFAALERVVRRAARLTEQAEALRMLAKASGELIDSATGLLSAISPHKSDEQHESATGGAMGVQYD